MSWREVKLSEVLKQYRIEHLVQNNVAYRQVTISKHNGVCVRGVKNGNDIGRKRQFIIDLKKYPNTLMFVRQGIEDGSIGIAPKEVDGCIATENMPMFSIENIETEFLKLIIGSSYFRNEVAKIPTTGSAQKSIHERQLLEIKIPCPSKAQQKEIVKEFSKIRIDNSELEAELTNQENLLKQLRQCFLREAMQGKLVKQDENEGNGTDLLQKIGLENEKLKKGKSFISVSEDETSFKIPDSWTWCRLGEIALNISTGPFGTMLHKSDYVQDGIPLVNPMNIVNEKIIASNKMMVNEKTKARLKSYILKTGDVVVGRRGEMGRCAVVTEKESGWLCGTGSFFLELHNEIFRPYFINVLSSDSSKSILLGSSVGSTMNNLNHKILGNLPFPLPPFQEQKRIVKKLEEVMNLCEELKTTITDNQNYTNQLLQVALKDALQMKKVKRED